MRPLRIGTRGSPLALIQTHEVIAGLAAHHPMLTVEIVPIKTTGDTIVDRSLIDMGGKSLFTKEIEQALLKGEIDLAVHSMKDVTADVPEGLIIPSMLKREDPRDALITYKHKPLEELPTGAIFGTSSLRRQAYVLHKYPHMAVVSLRGNVATRLEKVEKGKWRQPFLLLLASSVWAFLIKQRKFLISTSSCPLLRKERLAFNAAQTMSAALTVLPASIISLRFKRSVQSGRL